MLIKTFYYSLLRIPGSTNVMKTWQQFISDTSSSGDSDDDLMAYAAAAGKAMEDSDEDVFSIQLPDHFLASATRENKIGLTSKGVVTKRKSSKSIPTVGNAVVKSKQRPSKGTKHSNVCQVNELEQRQLGKSFKTTN